MRGKYILLLQLVTGSGQVYLLNGVFIQSDQRQVIYSMSDYGLISCQVPVSILSESAFK